MAAYLPTFHCLARCSGTSVLHHNPAVRRVLTLPKSGCSDSPWSYLKLHCSLLRGLQRLSPLLKETRLPPSLRMTTVSGCFCYNTESSLSLLLCLVPFLCHCGATHLRLQATDDPSANTVLLLSEPHEWQGCLVQFDGSAHKHTQTGGAGVSLLHVTSSSTSLVQWLSIPLLSCSDNVVAEAHACRAAINLAFEYYVSCMSRGIPIDSVVVQGDILPVINYLQYKGRIKKPAVVAILEQCQQLLARAPCLFRLVYLPRECNRLADYFAGQASTAAKEAGGNPLVPLHHAALPPFQLAQALGFIIQQGDASQVPAFVLTECSSGDAHTTQATSTLQMGCNGLYCPSSSVLSLPQRRVQAHS